MSIVHRVTGYDRQTERLVREWDVPPDLLPDLKVLAHVPRHDRQAAGSYPLDRSAVLAIAERLRLDMSPERYDWFLEPFAEDAPGRA